MPNVKGLVRELAQYAMQKQGAQQDSSWALHDVLKHPHVELPLASWGEFFEVEEKNGGHVAEIPVFARRLKEHQKRYPQIRESEWMERDGHIQMIVPLDAGIPTDFLKSLIDEAYEIVSSKLDARARQKLELSGLPYDESKLIDRLIEMHELQEQRKAIRKLARPAILLLTKKTSEAKIPLGATKIGGRPDLPAKMPWPTYRDGKPLAFLAQINLAEIAKTGKPIKGLPTEGLLSVFSVWGWMTEDDADPHTPQDGTGMSQEENGWTIVLHTPRRARLARRNTPRGVTAFPAAGVKPAPILSLPNHRAEPPVAALKWSEELYRRFDDMQSDYRSLQMSHWIGQRNSMASHHLLGGYALFQQQFPEEVLEKKLAMFLQIGSDGNSGMCWGDGGELTFYADAKALAKGRFERVWADCQGG